MIYEEIDRLLIPWIEAKGYQLQTRDRDEEVRAFLIWSRDHQKKAQIGVMKIGSDEIEIRVFDGRRRRERYTSSIEGLVDSLDKAEELARKWIE